jgi:hypothetical protein
MRSDCDRPVEWDLVPLARWSATMENGFAGWPLETWGAREGVWSRALGGQRWREPLLKGSAGQRTYDTIDLGSVTDDH